MNYTFTFTEQEANYMLQALAAKPYGEVAPLISKLQKQVQTQVHPEEEPEKEESPQEES